MGTKARNNPGQTQVHYLVLDPLLLIQDQAKRQIAEICILMPPFVFLQSPMGPFSEGWGFITVGIITVLRSLKEK